MKKHFQQYMNHHGASIRDLVEEDVDDISSMISTAEVAHGMGIFREAIATEVVGTMNDAFHRESIALHILHKQYPKKDDLQKVIGLKTKIGRLCGNLRRLVGWLSCCYWTFTRHEQSLDIWSHMTSKRYNTGTLKSISHLYLGEHILHKFDFFPTLSNSAFEAEFDSHSIEFLLAFHMPI